MGLDIICIVFVAVFCILGLLSGFLSQVVRLAALVGAFVLAYSAGAYTKPLLMKWMDVDNVMGDLLALFLGWMACYIAIILIGTIVAKIIKKSSGSIKVLDRILGGALGSVKGFLIVYLIACALVLLREPLKDLVPKKHLDLKGSRLAAFAEEHNVLSRVGIPDLDKLEELTSAFEDKKKRLALLNDPAMKELKQNKAFQRLMNDKAFQKAVNEKQLSAIVNNPNFRAAINDPQIRKYLSTLDLEKISKVVNTK
jgi:uncharacterized membrane protein required for colicin V production